MTSDELRFSADESFAVRMDAEDSLRSYRERFHIPLGDDGKPVIYFCGNSLGLMPKSARGMVEQELEDWARFAVDAHFHAKNPWYSYHENFRETGARLVGARPGEVVMMNSLTVNLHLMMVSFYRPTRSRYKILIDGPTFPSDTYAVKSQIQSHGLDPADALMVISPVEGTHSVSSEQIEAVLAEQGESIALVLLAGVNFFNGQVMDMPRLIAAAQRKGCIAGLDLAHAAGNLPLQLHDWNADFAVWCSYKYLNSGPGAVAGCFVHDRHAKDRALVRYAGWWGNDPATRFQMHREKEFIPVPSVEAWQISNPPILSMVPLRASLEIFDDVGMAKLRAKSVKLTGYLQFLLDRIDSREFEVITPLETEQRGCQLSILVHQGPREVFGRLKAAGIVCDFREPNVIRVAPTPLYNTFEEVWRFARVLAKDR